MCSAKHSLESISHEPGLNRLFEYLLAASANAPSQGEAPSKAADRTNASDTINNVRVGILRMEPIVKDVLALTELLTVAVDPPSISSDALTFLAYEIHAKASALARKHVEVLHSLPAAH